MGILDLLVAFGFTCTCGSFIGVAVVNRLHLGVSEYLAAAVLSLAIAAAWASMIYKINTSLRAKVYRVRPQSKEDLFFNLLVGLDVFLVGIGSMIAWALIPIFRLIHVFK